MNLTQNTSRFFIFCCVVMFTSTISYAQTKRIKRPKSRVGSSSIDNFVRESFDLYDKVYMYDGYAEAGTPLDDDDIDVLEDALDDLTGLSDSAPDILSDIGDLNVLKQAKATLQLNKSKKALKYSIKTVKKLLTESRKKKDEDEESEDENTDDTATKDTDSPNNSTNNPSTESDTSNENSNTKPDLKVSSKFDYVPGDKLIFFDDFSQDFIGDFPSKWNTNGSGEVVTLNTEEGKWFEIKPGYRTYYIPIVDQNLPEEYTIEFDVLAYGIDNKTSSAAKLSIILDDNNTFNFGNNYVYTYLPFCQYTPIGIGIENRIAGKKIIGNTVTANVREDVLQTPHISIAVNKKRYRLWVNQKKYIDVPQLVAPNSILTSLKFELRNFKDGKERLFIRNLKIAEGGLDLRRQLMANGKVSTNGILFDSGSANIQPQSYGIIRQISQVLMQDKSMRLNIIGHTDSDGNDTTNMKLSKSRAEAVREALISVYKISADRLQTDGKGESEPVSDNSTTDGKAQNRRVEFVKI